MAEHGVGASFVKSAQLAVQTSMIQLVLFGGSDDKTNLCHSELLPEEIYGDTVKIVYKVSMEGT